MKILSRFKSFRIGTFLAYLMIACLYPVYAYVSTGVNPLLPCINAMTIVGIVFFIMGIIINLIHHGDFDITEYVAKRAVNRGRVKSFEAFKSDKKEKRETQFNYALLTGIVMILISALMAVFLY